MKLLGLLAATLVLTGCGAAGNSIVLYNGQHTQLTSALVAAFTKRTGIQVQVRTNDSIVLADQLLVEGGDSPADVFMSENSPELQTLAQRGMLAHLPVSTLAAIPARDESPSGDWVGIALRVSALIDNRSAPQLPASILDLAQPQWQGKVALAPTDADFPPLVSAVLHADGLARTRTWLSGLRRNAQLYQSDEAVAAAVNRGSVPTGIINSYYWYRLRYQLGAAAVRSRLFYFPHRDPGSVENISGAAIIRSGPNRADAERFLAFLTGPEAQQIISRSDDFEYPLRATISVNPQLPPLTAVMPDVLSPAQLGNGQLASRLIQQSGLD